MFYISAYVSSPSPAVWDESLEAHYFTQLAKDDRICGLEHAVFPSEQGRYPAAFLRTHMAPHWDLLVTDLPQLFAGAAMRDDFGIASKIPEGRKAAVAMVTSIADEVCLLNDMFSRKVVRAVHLHTAPQGKGDLDCLQRSLEEIQALAFDGAQVHLEHCDAYQTRHAFEKGYLPIKEELLAIQDFHTCGMVLNWARSVIETRNKETPLEHLRLALEAKKLKGFFFSGLTPQESPYGAWRDTHAPFQGQSRFSCSQSLLGKEEIAAVLALLVETDAYLGIKVNNKHLPINVENSVGVITSAIDTVHACA